MWSKANAKERKNLVISEVVRMKEESYKVKAVGQYHQGRWSTWEAVVNRSITWADMWRIPQAWLSFLIRGTYDTLPSSQNISTWYGTEESCHLCHSQNPSLKHILSSCRTALTQGRYRWRHDRVLRKLVEILEARRLEVNKASPVPSQGRIHFVRQGDQVQSTISKAWSLLTPGAEWALMADLDQQLRFPREITLTSLRPDIIFWSSHTKTVIMVELTVPWEEGMEAAFERKKERYAELAIACSEAGWRAFTFPLEVWCRGYIGTSVPGHQRHQTEEGHQGCC